VITFELGRVRWGVIGHLRGNSDPSDVASDSYLKGWQTYPVSGEITP